MAVALATFTTVIGTSPVRIALGDVLDDTAPAVRARPDLFGPTPDPDDTVDDVDDHPANTEE